MASHQLTYRDGYAYATVQGRLTFDALTELVDAVQVDSLARKYKRLLIDLLEAEGTISIPDRFRLGEIAARKLAHMDRVALVVRANERTGTTEEAAKAMQLDLRVMTSVAEAEAWLAS